MASLKIAAHQIGAQPPLTYLPPTFNRGVLWAAQQGLPVWMRSQTTLRSVEARNPETLVKLYDAFQTGKSRFLLAFRHPSPEDAFALASLLWYQLPLTAKAMGIKLQQPVHGHFIYDRGIPLWAGRWVGWLYAQLGGSSIQRGKLDMVALRAARDLFVNGRFPLVAAPEGGNNGHNELVSPLEPGLAQMSFWCVDDLRKADRAETVYILPLGIQYQYLEQPWQAVEALLSDLEQASGLTVTATERYQRLYQLSDHLLQVMEAYYQRYYKLSPLMSTVTDAPNAQLAERLHRLMDCALAVAENGLGLSPKGSVIDRCRRLEQAGWERIYREDYTDPSTLSPVARGLADRLAQESTLHLWHMRMVESFVAVTGYYVLENPTIDRFAETVLLLRDMVTRIQGKNPFPRPQLGAQRVILTVGEPISVSDRWSAYQQSRKQAVETLTQDLQAALEGMIIH